MAGSAASADTFCAGTAGASQSKATNQEIRDLHLHLHMIRLRITPPEYFRSGWSHVYLRASNRNYRSSNSTHIRRFVARLFDIIGTRPTAGPYFALRMEGRFSEGLDPHPRAFRSLIGIAASYWLSGDDEEKDDDDEQEEDAGGVAAGAVDLSPGAVNAGADDDLSGEFGATLSYTK